MATYALVHGAWHGAWCWERLTPELEGMGHRVIAMDLPIEDSGATFDDYATVVCDATKDVTDEDLVLVGHSMGGQTVPIVAGRRPLLRLVYLCGVPPIPGKPFVQQMAEESEMLNVDYQRGLGEKDSAGRRGWVDKERAHFHLYGDCDEASASVAFMRLRQQSLAPYKLPSSLAAYPAVDTTYVLCSDDRMVNPDWSRRISRDWLNAEPIEIPGSHSPFYSRPRMLAALLNQLTGR
ncbi:alpha/beta fold hydrolase [Mycobacterium sp. NPDC051804]|uniref:alpha/beta fold hydrolase n=1 Tax=Mycobacterium sp. NPDC051804 TaxID=3364295 RepID=UPI00379D60CF